MKPASEDIGVADMPDNRVLLAWMRTHMANERTFLAWIRTGIALLAFGFVIERFDIFLKESGFAGASSKGLVLTQVAGMASFGIGICVICIGGWRFFSNRRLINRSAVNFSTMPEAVFVTVMLVLAMVLLSVFFLYFLR